MASSESEIDRLRQEHAKLLHISEHLANERTILAWIRTALAIMTLGVGINRFSLFLIEFAQTVPGARPGHHLSNLHAEEVGTGLVFLGVLMLMGATLHYLHVARTIDDGSFRPSRLIIILTSIAILVTGGASLIWLMV